MKKFTLEFINPALEEEFQNTKIIGVHKPVYKWLVICAFGYEIAGAIQCWIMDQTDKALLPIIMAAVLFVNFVSSIKYPSTMKINQIISVYLGLISLFDVSTATTSNDYYIFGATVQLWQCCIISMCGFKHSIHLITITTFFRLSVLIYNTTTDYRDTFGGFISALTFLVQNYLSDKIDRTQFLLTKKDLRWQQYMPTIIEKPYFVFEYSQLQQCFLSNEQTLHKFIPFNVSKDITLRQFLRSASINNETLEQYLFRYYLRNHTQITPIQVLYNRQYLAIQLFDLNIQNNQYLMIINPPLTDKIMNKNRQQNTLLQYWKFVSCNMKIHNNKKLIKDTIFKMKTQITNNLYLSSIYIFNERITQVNLTKLILKLQRMYNLGHSMNIEFDTNSNVYLKSYQSQVFAFINYLFLLFHQQYVRQSQIIKIILDEQDSATIQLTICVPDIKLFLYEYSKIQIFQQLEYSLLHSPLTSNLELKFMRELEKSYQIIKY